ncbi:predicted protein [Uncinocarpus reesii 1704]|uniref:Uncharacterized protein n=1 Tax=Uncinocarpus reesii (strain UAMH 1704) TaxID=336963 RepID=C4JWS2_UNCRE|nr:uncharacterized protein UREG_07014 [Uncinocarpus reesii 1704]EEP82149.1 predicted protein [Uncinocarpus reesii 1704]
MASDQFNTLLQQISTQQEQAAATLPQVVYKQEGKQFPEPDLYKGWNWKKYWEFIQACESYLKAKSRIYAAEKEKIKYVAARLWDNLQASWDLEREHIDWNAFTFNGLKTKPLDWIEAPENCRCTAARRMTALHF